MNVRPFSFSAPPLAKTIIPTGFMVEMENRFKDVFHEGGFLVWYGAAGGGKTTCGEWLSERINDAFDPDNPLAFRTLLYEVAKNSGTNTGKRALRTLYKSIVGYPLDTGLYRDSDTEAVADEVLYAIKRKRLGAICVDEAGLLSVDAISAMVLLLDRAKHQKYHLTIILIGMDDLPVKMNRETRPQLHRRVEQWCNFKDYELEDSYNLLSGLHPYFKTLDRGKPDQWQQVVIIHELTGGLPGLIVQFLAKFDSIYKKIPQSVNTTLLRGIHLQNLGEYNEIQAAAKGKKVSSKELVGATNDGRKK